MCTSAASAVVSWSISGPERVVASVGSRVPVACSAEPRTTDVCWEFYPDRSSIPRTIYAGSRGHVNHQYTSSHRVQVDDGHVTMTLLNAQLADAGRYHCRQCAAAQYAAVEVVLLGKVSAVRDHYFPPRMAPAVTRVPALFGCGKSAGCHLCKVK